MVHFDSMHVMDMGCVLYLIASVLWELVETVVHANGWSREKAWDHIWQQIQMQYRALNIAADHRVTHLALKHIVNIKAPTMHYPVLHGVKANDTSTR